MEFVLEAPKNFISEGSKLIVPQIEHRLKITYDLFRTFE